MFYDVHPILLQEQKRVRKRSLAFMEFLKERIKIVPHPTPDFALNSIENEKSDYISNKFGIKTDISNLSCTVLVS